MQMKGMIAMTDRERLIEIIGKPINILDSDDLYGAIADHLLENGVIVPPVNIDDYVYQYNDILKEIHGYRIEEVIYYGKIFNYKFSYQAICQTHGIVIRFSESEIGKTVFLTREEAEKALAERQEDVNND